MKLNGKISILVNSNGATIEVKDSLSGIQFLGIQLSAEQFMSCLGRLAMVECEFDLVGVEKVGKKLENKKFEFCINGIKYEKQDKESALWQIAQEQLTDGWIADRYFGSQDSFFQKNGEQWARVTISRWV